MIAIGLALALVSAAAINAGYALQHDAASRLPPLSVRRPVRSLRVLIANRRWLVGFVGGIGGWAIYVTALRLAPLSLVQAASAGGIAVLALGVGRLAVYERVGVIAAIVGLAALALSLGSHASSGGVRPLEVALWMAVSVVVVAVGLVTLPRPVALAGSAGVLYAAGDVGTKAAVGGGAQLLFVPAVLLAHGLAFGAMQLAFQRGGRLATAGVAVLLTNALPILAGTILFAEGLPGGWFGATRVAAFALVLLGAVALSARVDAPEAAATLSID